MLIVPIAVFLQRFRGGVQDELSPHVHVETERVEFVNNTLCSSVGVRLTLLCSSAAPV